jgi:hypothetical protein
MNQCEQANGTSIKVGQDITINDEWHVISAEFPDVFYAYRISDGKECICNKPFMQEAETYTRSPQRLRYEKVSGYYFKPFDMGDTIYYYAVSDNGDCVNRAVVKSGVFVNGNLKYIEIIDERNPLENIKINPQLAWSYAN